MAGALNQARSSLTIAIHMSDPAGAQAVAAPRVIAGSGHHAKPRSASGKGNHNVDGRLHFASGATGNWNSASCNDLVVQMRGGLDGRALALDDEAMPEVTQSVSLTSPTASHPLVRLRNRRNLSREVLAALAGVSPRTIYAIEVEGVRPQRATLRVLCMALGCEAADLGFAQDGDSQSH
jgi:DNA-binding XRE family transcriptional regulator